MSDDPRAQSEFNMAVSYLNRLNALFYAADDASINLDAHAWFHTLLALRRELSTEMKKEEITSIETDIRTINTLLLKNTQLSQRIGRNQIIPELYEKLDHFEITIRRVLKDAGLQNRMLDDAMKALK